MTDTNQNIEVSLQAEHFYPFVQGVANLADEANLAFTREGLSISTMDNTSISMIKATLPKQYCTKYETGNQDISIGLNMENLLTMIPKKDAIIEMKRISPTMLELKIASTDQTETVGIPIIEVKETPNKTPEIAFTAFVEVDAKTLKEIIKKAKLISSVMTITATQENMAFSAKGDSGSMNSIFNRAKFPTKYSVTGKGSLASFNLDYLTKIIKTAQKDTLIELAMKSEDPIRINYMVGQVKFQYYLAPFMES